MCTCSLFFVHSGLKIYIRLAVTILLQNIQEFQWPSPQKCSTSVRLQHTFPPTRRGIQFVENRAAKRPTAYWGLNVSSWKASRLVASFWENILCCHPHAGILGVRGKWGKTARECTPSCDTLCCRLSTQHKRLQSILDTCNFMPNYKGHAHALLFH